MGHARRCPYPGNSLLTGVLTGLCAPGVTPRSGWAVDPFGYSSTMPYLLKRSNLTGMVIQRVHYAIKKHFAATQNLEFMWRQAWGEGLLGGGHRTGACWGGGLQGADTDCSCVQTAS